MLKYHTAVYRLKQCLFNILIKALEYVLNVTFFDFFVTFLQYISEMSQNLDFVLMEFKDLFFKAPLRYAISNFRNDAQGVKKKKGFKDFF